MNIYKTNNVEFLKGSTTADDLLKMINTIIKDGVYVQILFIPDEEDLYNSSVFIYNNDDIRLIKSCLVVKSTTKPLNTMLIYTSVDIEIMFDKDYEYYRETDDKPYNNILSDIMYGRKVSLNVHGNDIDLRVDMASYIFADYDSESKEDPLSYRYNGNDIYSITINNTENISGEIIKFTKCKLPME